MKSRITVVAVLVMIGAGILAAAASSIAQPTGSKKKLGAAIDGYRWEFPCKGVLPENPKAGADCESGLVTGDPKKTDNFTAERKFNGEKGKRYKVTLRFRGVVEPMMYKDGKMDGDYFYIGGEPNNNTYNIYKITISSPAGHYFLNRQDKVGHKNLHDRLHQAHRDRRRGHRDLPRRRPKRRVDFQFPQTRRARCCSPPRRLITGSLFRSMWLMWWRPNNDARCRRPDAPREGFSSRGACGLRHVPLALRIPLDEISLQDWIRARRPI